MKPQCVFERFGPQSSPSLSGAETPVSKLLNIWLVCLLLAFSGAAKADSTLTLVADEWPPFSGETLPGNGISIDVISTVLTRAGYQVKSEILPWARIMDGSRDGEFDIVGSLFFDNEIAAYMTYGDPFFTTEIKFVQQTGDKNDVSSLDALQPYSIAVGDGFLYEEKFDRATHLNKVVVTTTLQAIQMVAFGRVNLTLDSEEVVRYAIEVEDPTIAEKVELLPHVLARHDVHMAVRNSLPNKDDIVSDFNATLHEMRLDGSLDKLLEKHK